MAINAIEMKLLMVKTFAQRLKIKIKPKWFPNNRFVCELWAANEDYVSHWNHEQTNKQNWVSITFCHFAEISVVRN